MNATLLVAILLLSLPTTPATARQSSRASTRTSGAADGLGVTLGSLPASVATGGDAAYVATVANTTGDAITNVALEHRLSGHAVVAGARPSQGTCTLGGDRCSLGTLEPGARAAIAFVVRPHAEGHVAVHVHVVSADRGRTAKAVSALTVVNPPTDLSAIRFRPEVVLAWTASSHVATGFEIERASGDAPFVKLGTVGRDATTFRDRSAVAGRAYTYRVRAVTRGAPSAYSNELTVTVTEAASPRHERGSRGAKTHTRR